MKEKNQAMRYVIRKGVALIDGIGERTEQVELGEFEDPAAMVTALQAGNEAEVRRLIAARQCGDRKLSERSAVIGGRLHVDGDPIVNTLADDLASNVGQHGNFRARLAFVERVADSPLPRLITRICEYVQEKPVCLLPSGEIVGYAVLGLPIGAKAPELAGQVLSMPKEMPDDINLMTRRVRLQYDFGLGFAVHRLESLHEYEARMTGAAVFLVTVAPEAVCVVPQEDRCDGTTPLRCHEMRVICHIDVNDWDDIDEVDLALHYRGAELDDLKEIDSYEALRERLGLDPAKIAGNLPFGEQVIFQSRSDGRWRAAHIVAYVPAMRSAQAVFDEHAATIDDDAMTVYALDPDRITLGVNEMDDIGGRAGYLLMAPADKADEHGDVGPVIWAVPTGQVWGID